MKEHGWEGHDGESHLGWGHAAQVSAFPPRGPEMVLLQLPTSVELLVSPLLGLDGRNFIYSLLCNIPAWQLQQ